MYAKAKKLIEKKYGSINKLAKVINVESGDLYCAFKGTKPMHPKYRKLIAEALNEDVVSLFAKE